MTALRTATVHLLLAREVRDLNTAADLFKELKRLITIESTLYGLEDRSCHPSARSSCCGCPGFIKCDVDIRKDLYAKGVWSDGVANVSYAKFFFQ